MNILVASDVGPALQFPKFPADGVVGLGFKNFLGFIRDSFFEDLVNQGGIVDGKPVFGLSLAEPGPELVIGGTDTSKFSGELTFVDLENTVSILRGAPCHGLTRTRYRVSGRSGWVLYQSTETSFQSALMK